ncbi:hypothetical protein TYRP_006741 [Tyrophagus putrescentiae]|nr:hypothetical protein TYRP_006741 [Tyrophagus putrescentiae]
MTSDFTRGECEAGARGGHGGQRSPVVGEWAVDLEGGLHGGVVDAPGDVDESAEEDGGGVGAGERHGRQFGPGVQTRVVALDATHAPAAVEAAEDEEAAVPEDDAGRVAPTLDHRALALPHRRARPSAEVEDVQ